MPNLVVTNRCNLDCPFCFASEYRGGAKAASGRAMTLEDFDAQLDFAATDTARFCGGEPTLHPDFSEMLRRSLASRERVLLMTNGVWPTPVREHIASLARRDRKRINYLVNVLEPARYRPGQWALLEGALGAMDRHRVTLGVTLYRAPYDASHLFQLAERFGISHLRFSVAAPNITDPRSWQVDPERDFPALAKIVLAFLREARARGLTVHSDCGYIPPCMYEPEELEELRTLAPQSEALPFSCSGPVDIGPGGEAWRCYGLYSVVRARASDFENGAALSAYFERRTQDFDPLFLFDACAECSHRLGGNCGGGCYAFRVRRHLTKRAREDGIGLDDAGLLEAVAKRDPTTLHPWQAQGRPGWMARQSDGSWEPLRLGAFEHAFLEAIDGRRTVAEVVAAIADGETATAERLQLVRGLYERGVVGLRPAAPSFVAAPTTK